MATTAGIKAGKAFIIIEAIDKTGAILGKVSSRLTKFADSIIKLGRQMTLAATFASIPLLVSLREYAEFDDMMRRVQGSAEGTAMQMVRLRKQARQLGVDTRYSAKQIAELQFMLAQKGFKRADIENMTPPIVTLARSAGTGSEEDVSQAADLAATVMRAFQVDVRETTHVVDLLAKAGNVSNLTLYSMSEAFSYIGPMAKIANWSMEDTLTMMGVLGNFGIEASMAGTAIRGMTLSMSNVKARSKFDKALMAATGHTVDLVDAAGNFRKPLEVMHDLGNAMKGLGSADQLAILATLFHIPQMAGAATLTTQAKSLDELMVQLRDVDGYAKTTADLMDAGIGGALARMLQQIKAIGLAIGESFEKPLLKLLPVLGKMTVAIIDWIQAHQELVFLMATSTVAMFSFGGALIVTGVSLKLVAAGLGAFSFLITGLGLALRTATAPLLLLSKAIRLLSSGLGPAIRLTAMLVTVGIRALYSTLLLAVAATYQLGQALARLALLVVIATVRLTAQAFGLLAVAVFRVGAALMAVFVRAGVMLIAQVTGMVFTLTLSMFALASSAFAFLVPLLAAMAPILAIAAGIGLVIALVVMLSSQLSSALSSSATAAASSFTKAKDSVINSLTAMYASVKGIMLEMYNTMSRTLGSVFMAVKLGEYGLAWKVLWTGIKTTWLEGTGYIRDVWGSFSTTLLNAITIFNASCERLMINLWAGIKSIWITATNGLAEVLWKFLDFVVGPVLETLQGVLIQAASAASMAGNFIPGMDKTAESLQRMADQIGGARAGLTKGALAAEAEYQAELAANEKWRLDSIKRITDAEQAAIRVRLAEQAKAAAKNKDEIEKLQRELNAAIFEVNVAYLKKELTDAFTSAKDLAAEAGDYLGQQWVKLGSMFDTTFGTARGASDLLQEPLKANVGLEKGSMEAAKAEIENNRQPLNDILDEEKKHTGLLDNIGRALGKGALAIVEKG